MLVPMPPVVSRLTCPAVARLLASPVATMPPVPALSWMLPVPAARAVPAELSRTMAAAAGGRLDDHDARAGGGGRSGAGERDVARLGRVAEGDGAGSRAVDLLSARSGEDLGELDVGHGQSGARVGVAPNVDGQTRICAADDDPAGLGAGPNSLTELVLSM